MALHRESRQIRQVRCVFFGTPAIAVPSLEALTQIGEVVAAVSQPDRPGGRGMKPQVPAVKSWAVENGLTVIQPDGLKNGDLARWIAQQSIDISVVLAYGRILPPDLLRAPRLGCVNLHASLLPRHRGAAPIPWSIMLGDVETGVSLMQMDEGLDTGPVIVQHKLTIDPRETTGTLTGRISQLCAEVVRAHIPEFVTMANLEGERQNGELATWAPPIRAKDRRLNFDDNAVALDARVRALTPPGAITSCKGRLLRILESRPLADDSGGPAGTVKISENRRILVSTRAGSLELIRAQFEGKKPLLARDLINGRALCNNDLLGE